MTSLSNIKRKSTFQANDSYTILFYVFLCNWKDVLSFFFLVDLSAFCVTSCSFSESLNVYTNAMRIAITIFYQRHHCSKTFHKTIKCSYY